MNWEAIGALSEIISAAAVVATLVFLAIQTRQNTDAVEEGNRLARIAAIDTHAESVRRWRASLAENREIGAIWLKALKEEPLDDLESLRLHNMFINLVNIQRANYERACAIGEEGLARQASRAIAAECPQNKVFSVLWNEIRDWQSLSSAEYVAAVDREIALLGDGKLDLPHWLTFTKAFSSAGDGRGGG